MKYLIVLCEELGDQWECDANRTPLYVTEDISEWKNKYGYEIYEILKNGELELIKEYYDYEKPKKQRRK